MKIKLKKIERKIMIQDFKMEVIENGTRKKNKRIRNQIDG